MNIVVLDSDPAFGCQSASPEARGELDTSHLESLGTLTSYPGTAPADVIERARDARVILTNKVVIGAAELEKLPQLKLISVLATGVNVIDLDAARAAGVTVCNVPGYSTMSTAQHAFSLLLELCQHVGVHADDVKEGGWVKSEPFSYFKTPLVELDGQVMGLVGFGAIGQQVARQAQAFGMRVIVHTRTERSAPGIEFVDKKTLLEQSDVISLHCPLTESTKHFIDDDALSLVKPSAFLINVARGPVVDEAAVASALKAGTLAGAATDVLSVEPAQSDCPLLSAPRCLITPHIAWASHAARTRLLDITVKNIKAFQNGTPQNVVAP
jgi:glycerate dehydrogenase